MTQASLNLGAKQLSDELWFVGRLRDHLAQIFTGDTDPDTRRERIRRAIVNAEIQTVILGKNAAGKPETYADAFQRLYGEPLQINSKGTRA